MVVYFKKLTETAIKPTRGTSFSAGLDLYADNSEPVTIQPHCKMALQTGISMELPDGFFGGVYPRSGISTKRGLRLCNCVGVIDSDYRGNIGVSLYNDSNEPQTIEPHERVAQLVIQPYATVTLTEGKLTDSERGTNGFGSTGKN